MLRHLDSAETVVLRGTAALVWIGLEEAGVVDDLAADIVAVVPETAAGQVSAELDRLVELGFVVAQ